jgi:serine/threonine protein kinase
VEVADERRASGVTVLATPRLEPGVVLAGYRLERVLGEGGMGVVYEATQLSLNRTVALKIVAPSLTVDAGFRARFRREGLIQAGLEHPNIVTVYESGEWQDVLFLAMRLVQGPSLKELIVSRQLDVRRSLQILVPVADALDAAHEQRLVHRDVKPQNILVDAKDHPYLADFGLTKGPDATAHTRTGSVMGSLDYISPEQIRGEPATTASDIYALTAVLFECLTRTVPFPRESDAALLYAHVNAPPPSVVAAEPDLPLALDELIACAMSKDPAERPPTATELMHEASEILDGRASGLRVLRPRPLTDADLPGTVGVQAPGRPATRATSSATSDESRATRSPTIVTESLALARRPRIAAALGVATAALATAGYLTGHGSAASGTRSGPTVRGGDIAITVPSAWRAPAQLPAIPGMNLRRPVSREDAATGGLVVAGIADGAGGARLLPQALLERIRAAPTGEPVRLGEGEALRYRNLAVAGMTQPLTLVVAPNSAGVAAVGCVSPGVAADRFLRTCERVAASLRVSNARALSLPPYQDYARALARVAEQLRTAAIQASGLASAASRAAQANLCRTLANAQSAAAKELTSAPAGPDAKAIDTRLEAAAKVSSTGYAAMAAAAAAGSQGAYDTARRRAETALRSERTALEELRVLGYGG